MNRKSENLTEKDRKLHEFYKFEKKLGKGCFGCIYLVTNVQTLRKSALKVEPIKRNEAKQTLNFQYVVLKRLQGINGVPEVLGFGRGENNLFLELPVLGKDLEKVMLEGPKIDEALICRAALELIEILSHVHHKKILHRDIKPQNIMLSDDNKFHLIDFGISELLNNRKPKAGREDERKFVGTPRYASLYAHRGLPQRPCDDIESLLYVLIYVYKKTLPWVNLNVEESNKIEAIKLIKQKKSKKELSRGMPSSFLLAFEHIGNLKFDEDPNYRYLKSLFQSKAHGNITQLSTNTLLPISPDLANMMKVLDNKQRRSSIELATDWITIPLVLGVTGYLGNNTALSQRAFMDPEYLDQIQEEDPHADLGTIVLSENNVNEPTLDERIKQLQVKVPKFKCMSVQTIHIVEPLSAKIP